MKRLMLHLVLVCLAHTVAAETPGEWKCNETDCFRVTEIWECVELRLTPDWNNILVEASVVENKKDDGSLRKFGFVVAANTKHLSAYVVNGFIRRWDFDLREDKTYNYAFEIEPSGDAKYYDFGEKDEAFPSLLMKCRQKNSHLQKP